MKKNYTKGFGARLREIRGDLSQSDLAGVLGVSRQNIADYETERAEPDLNFLVQVTSKLGVAINWLLTGEGKKTAKEKWHSTAKPQKGTVAKKGKGREDSSEFRIEATVPAGIGDITDHTDSFQYDSLDFQPIENYAWLRVSKQIGESMKPTINPDDLVLITDREKIKPGDIVAVWMERQKTGTIKIYNETKELVILTSYNQTIPPIVFSKEKDESKLYKVVLIKKK
jgi:phage repressor protein C with HTH and peptisase S24 domain